MPTKAKKLWFPVIMEHRVHSNSLLQSGFSTATSWIIILITCVCQSTCDIEKTLSITSILAALAIHGGLDSTTACN